MSRFPLNTLKDKILSALILCTIIVSIWYACSYTIPHISLSNTNCQLDYLGFDEENATTGLQQRIRNGLTIKCGLGELGNKMFYYAVVYGLSKLNKRHGYIQKCNTNTCRHSEANCKLETLDQIFNLNLPVGPNLAQSEQRGHSISFHITYPNDYYISPNANILNGAEYPCSVTHFLHVREQVRREFRFREKFEDYARSIVQPIKDKHPNNTLVGVHVRRNTYLRHLNVFNKTVAPPKFFHYAMQYFRKTFPSAKFLVVSDDIPWCRKNIVGEDVLVVPKMSSAANDLAVLSLCQHTIFDYGTYGLWAALLAGGKAMYYIDGITDPTEPDPVLAKKMYPPDWIGISDAMLNITT